jgi:hypothetical protein
MRRGLTSWIAVAVVACGGAQQSLVDRDGGADGSSGTDAAAGPCPASPPAANASCGAEMACEYGSDPDVTCDTVATCASGAWSVRDAPGTPCADALGAGCPASYAALTQQSTCTAVGIGTQCDYPEARCSCATQCGLVGRPEAFWCCPDAPSAAAGCPSTRPRLGSTCSSDGTVCDYGGCGGNITLACKGATWQPTTIGCPG